MRRVEDVRGAVEIVGGESREPAEEIGVEGRVDAAVREPVRDEQVMDLVAEWKRGRVVPGGERGVGRERRREHEGQRAVGLDAGEHGRRDANGEREHEEDADVIAVEPPEREREDDDEQRAPRDRIEREEPARPRGDEAGRDRERAGRGAERRDRETEDPAHNRVGRGLVDPDLRESAPEDNGRDPGAERVGHPCHARRAPALGTRGRRGSRARGGARPGGCGWRRRR